MMDRYYNYDDEHYNYDEYNYEELNYNQIYHMKDYYYDNDCYDDKEPNYYGDYRLYGPTEKTTKSKRKSRSTNPLVGDKNIDNEENFQEELEEVRNRMNEDIPSGLTISNYNIPVIEYNENIHGNQ
ncbi:hypothetical protein C1646_673926 [Rhizophagus diaphanus]|nr:hypothetical protein C1646_673926 [Rhizophagus diaphanus] [Rhizophagus sp. MUCL 43196]